MKNRFLKLSPRYYFLWIILWLILASKIFFILKATTLADVVQAVLFGIAMLAVSYLGAWGVWVFAKKEQRTGELAYLAILTVFFLVRTVLIYREAIAAGLR